MSKFKEIGILIDKEIKIVAPGRTCLFGDHQDYLGLPVIACAIDRHIFLNATRNDSKVFRIRMQDIDSKRDIPISEEFRSLEARDYFASALRVLRREGCLPNRGYDVDITGNIPINSGNSSSSAVLLAWIYFLIEAFGIDRPVDREFLAELGYRAEILEHREPGGMMDHFSIAMGGVVHIKTEAPFECSTIGSKLHGMVTGVSGVPKETVGLLGRVKGNAQKAIQIVSDKFNDFNIHKATILDLKKYGPLLPLDLVPYFEAAIENHHITQMALLEFQKPNLDLQEIGKLMTAHHSLLKDKLKITVPKIDVMIDAVLKQGAYGAKIVGSGGGGSIVVLTKPGTETKIVDALLSVGAKEAYTIQVDPGLRVQNTTHSNN
ncbi:mevalonate kinase [Maribacter sp. 4G9]|uniref:mevalonate kinase family protein n=1 Tax=Maribacter sp. 4G9 TaxID=1889777 RepID=UPI001F0A0D9D|nr:galactokinase family protein [Maribacter sp. 4G9]